MENPSSLYAAFSVLVIYNEALGVDTDTTRQGRGKLVRILQPSAWHVNGSERLELFELIWDLTVERTGTALTRSGKCILWTKSDIQPALSDYLSVQIHVITYVQRL